MSSETKVWLITGTSSGLGLSIATYALEKGDNVVATLRKPEVLAELATQYPETLLVLKLDVTQPSEVTAAFAAGRAKFGRIDVVVNNAGLSHIGEVEAVSDGTARRLFEVNFWGASHVTKEAVRCFREENTPMGGRLIQVSSEVGIHASPCIAYYSASKFALEALSEGIVGELDPSWNIKISIFVPGPFRSNVSSNMLADAAHPAYTHPSMVPRQARDFFANPSLLPQLFNGDPNKFAEAVYKVACMADPPLRLPFHPSAVAVMKKKGNLLLEAADKWAPWSEDVLIKA